jgi:hypothetical protein
MSRLIAAIGLAILGQTDLAPAPRDAAEHHEAGVAFHLERCLAAAGREYDAALALEPPRAPAADQRTRILRLTPRVFVNAREPFALRDAAAIHHPSAPIIAYHLFWEDDIDFPDDNDPSDHEVIWVRYGTDGMPERVWTLFHGRVIAAGPDAIADAKAHGGRARIDVQWGKHGPMPAGWQTLTIRTEDSDTDTKIPADRDMTLLEYNRLTWQKLSTEGTRGRANPLAIRYRWPSTFEGSSADFTTFAREIDPRDLLDRRSMMLVSRWNSGPLARHLVFYNFRPKLEWPDDAGDERR